MKTISLILLVFLAVCGNGVYAQNLIALLDNNSNTFYTNLDTAIAHANNGDYIYVPGGSWTLNNPINKGVHIVGVGYVGDSSNATGITKIARTGNYAIHVVSGADNGSLTGIYFYAGVLFGTTTTDMIVNNYTITRCRLLSCLFGVGNSNSIGISSNILISENFFDEGLETWGSDTIQSLNITKNIFGMDIYGFYMANIENNIFIGYSGPVVQIVNNSVFRNNIFIVNNCNCNNVCGSSNLNDFYNNLFITQPSVTGASIDLNSLYSVPINSIFVNLTGNTYDATADYHLQTSCLGHNYGTDGTDVGIYGTGNPFKVGSVPYNPHVQFKSINSSTNTNGDLPVNIQVGAQDY